MRGGFNANVIYDRSGEDLHSDNAICAVYGMYQHKSVDEQKDSKGLANAQLIAAAPELLDALREIAELADKVDGWQSFPPEPIQKAYDAIAKATGEQK
jgi:hypothetical protein